MDLATLPEVTDLPQRLEAVEAFNAQVGQAINDVVSAVIELRASVEAQGPAQAEIEALKSKLKEVEQQLNVERAGRDLAQVSRMHPKTRSAVFVGTIYFGDNVKYAWAAIHARAAELQLDVWFLPNNTEQEKLVNSLGGRCLPVGHANWQPEHIHAALSAAVVKKKNEKHSHTEGSRRKAIGCSGFAKVAAAPARSCDQLPCRSSIASRFNASSTITASATSAQPT